MSAASSGAVALFHLVGITPEAPTLAAACQGRPPQQTVRVTLNDLRAARRELTTAPGDRVDMVVLGSPHFSLAEFRQLAPLLAGQARHPRVRFIVTSSRAMVHLAEQGGNEHFFGGLAAFGNGGSAGLHGRVEAARHLGRMGHLRDMQAHEGHVQHVGGAE